MLAGCSQVFLHVCYQHTFISGVDGSWGVVHQTIWYESLPVINPELRKKCDNLTQVPRSSYFINGSESLILFEHLFWGLTAIERFVTKKSQNLGFRFQSVLKLEL